MARAGGGSREGGSEGFRAESSGGIREEGGGGFGRSGGWRGSYSPPVVIKQHEYPMPAAPRPRTQSIIRDQRSMSLPRSDATGAPFRAGALQGPPAHAGIIRDPGFSSRIGIERGHELESGRFFWHRFGGYPYCHTFFDGVDWYGFYFGSAFFWTRYYDSYWWWYDPVYARWVFWYNDYWWWPGPDNELYVYMDNNYFPYDSERQVATVKRPQVMQPPTATPPSAAEGGGVASPDNSRLLRVLGPGNEAFLYEKKDGQEPVFLKYLGKDVTEGRFTKGEGGRGTVLILTFQDGAYALFDNDGNPLDRPKPGPAAP